MAQSIDMDELLDDEIAARNRGDFVEDEEDILEDEDDREPEDLEEEEEEDPEDEDDEKPSEREDFRIPKSRLDEVISQREAERQRAEWLQAQLEKLLSPQDFDEDDNAYDFDTAESQYAEYLITGEADKAAKVRREIDNARKAELQATIERARTEALKAAEASSKQQLDEDRFNSLVEVYEQEYPFLDSASEDYNEEAVTTINTLMIGYMANGDSKTSSLKKAVKQAVKFYTKPKKTTLGDRKKEAIKKNVSASKKQPSRVAGKRNVDSVDVDVRKMTEKDFSQLSAREKAELRGDFFG